MERLIKTVESSGRKIDIYRQGMWLIASENNKEIERIELFGMSQDDGIEKIINFL